MNGRALIVHALSTVDGVDAHASFPRTLAPGCAWPEWARLTRDAYCSGEDTWHVFYLLRPGWDAAAEGIEAMVTPIWEALEASEITVVDAEHVQLPAEHNAPHAIKYTTTTPRHLSS